MKANELMLGDWVSYKGKMPCKITAICKDTVVVDNDTAQDWRIDYDKLTPIPLTAEILEKNGFKRVPIDYDKEMRSECYACDGIDWVIYANQFMLCRKGDWVGLGIDITYVHELQHALRLCGIEKEIEL